MSSRKVEHHGHECDLLKNFCQVRYETIQPSGWLLNNRISCSPHQVHAFPFHSQIFVDFYIEWSLLFWDSIFSNDTLQPLIHNHYSSESSLPVELNMLLILFHQNILSFFKICLSVIIKIVIFLLQLILIFYKLPYVEAFFLIVFIINFPM